jgi:hypothetical protein
MPMQAWLFASKYFISSVILVYPSLLPKIGILEGLRLLVIVVWALNLLLCMIWLDVLIYTKNNGNPDPTRQERLGKTIDFASSGISCIALLTMASAMTMITVFARKVQRMQPGKLKFNIPLFLLHLTLMMIEAVIRITGDWLKYRKHDKLEEIAYLIQEARLGIVFNSL